MILVPVVLVLREPEVGTAELSSLAAVDVCACQCLDWPCLASVR